MKARYSDWYWTGQAWLGNLLEDEPRLRRLLHQHDVLAKVNKLRQRWRTIKASYDQVSTIGDGIFNSVFNLSLWKLQIQASCVMAFARRFYLTDDVGLGKTLSIFACLVLLYEWGLIEHACVITTDSVKFCVIPYPMF